MWRRYGSVGSNYRLATRASANDSIIVGCDKSGAFATKGAFPNSRLVCGVGRDGADNALIAAVDLRVLFEQFDVLMIGSGDNKFAFLAAQAQSAGLITVGVIGVGDLARSLEARLDGIIYLADLTNPMCEHVRSAA